MKLQRNNKVRERILSIFEEEKLILVNENGKDINFDRLDSLNVMYILAVLETKLSIEIDLEEINFQKDFLNVDNLINFLIQNSKDI